MDWADSERQAAFRVELRSFIAERLPQHYRDHPDRLNELGHKGGWQWDRQSDDPVARAASV